MYYKSLRIIPISMKTIYRLNLLFICCFFNSTIVMTKVIHSVIGITSQIPVTPNHIGSINTKITQSIKPLSKQIASDNPGFNTD